MKRQVIQSICGFCHTNCGVRIHMQNGSIVRIEGDQDHPVNRGHLCPKAQGLKPLLESEERLRFPLKKTKGGFTRISWDEALDLAADKLLKIRKTHGPESLFHAHGAPVTYGARDGFLQFMGTYGSPNYTGVANTCHVPRAVAFAGTFSARPEPDYENARLVVFWGTNPANTTRFCSYAAYDGFHRIIPRLKERGVRIVAVDPVRSETAALADDWISPNIGTDTALGLAMVHTIIEEGLWDEAFVGKWVVGFDEVRSHVKPATPEWAEAVTSVPADRIREFARLYAKTDGAVILEGNGMDMHTNGVDMVRTICMLIALTGNIDKPGGNVYFSIVPQTPLPTVRPEKTRMAAKEFPLFPQVPFPAFKEALLNERPDRPRAMIVHHTNPVLVQGNQERTGEALKKLDFLMVMDVFPTATSEIADLVLPVAADLEAVDYRAYSSSRGGFVAFREKVAEPAGEARSVFEIEYELARKMGMAETYPFTNAEEWIDFVLKPAGITVADLRNNRIIYASPPVVFRKYEKEGFRTPSGKVECFSERFRKAGYPPLPVFEQPKESPVTDPDVAAVYPLKGTTRKPAEFVHTKLRNLAVVNSRYPDPCIMIHPVDAASRGIRSDDAVEVQSPRGKVRVKARITEDIRPGMIAVDFGWGNPTDNKPGINLLTSDAVWDPVSGGYPNRLFLCQVKRIDMA